MAFNFRFTPALNLQNSQNAQIQAQIRAAQLKASAQAFQLRADIFTSIYSTQLINTRVRYF